MLPHVFVHPAPAVTPATPQTPSLSAPTPSLMSTSSNPGSHSFLSVILSHEDNLIGTMRFGKCLRWSNLKHKLGTFLVVQWLRPRAPNIRGLGLIPGQWIRSHMPHLRVHILQLKIPHVTDEDQRSRVLQLRPPTLQPHGLYNPWNSPGQNTGVGSRSLLQGIFPTQGSNPGLLNCRQILYQLSHQGSQPRPSLKNTHKLIKPTVRYHFTLTTMAMINIDENKCWWGCGGHGTVTLNWWECKWCSYLYPGSSLNESTQTYTRPSNSTPRDTP